MVKIQFELSNNANAVVSYYKAKNNLKTKEEAINYILELKGSDLQ